MKVTLQAARIFSKAAEYIRCYGWQESGMGVDGAPRCSMGALASANPEKIWNKKLGSLMYNTLYKELNGESLTEFNKRVKSGEKVARLFERVASMLVGSESVKVTSQFLFS
ncbi:MAG TPA: hypothetical protein VKC53_03760 [Patescibacteria group bacterium]|nr:hypothetical protein [Patescibacteria group bacterium]